MRSTQLRWQAWVEHQKLKVQRGLDWLEQNVDQLAEEPDIGSITIGCALGYLDFRFGADKWREGRARLAAWFERFEARPSMQATMPRQL